MRAVIQRVKKASVSVEGKVISSIGPGLCVLVGIHEEDSQADMEKIAKKILSARLFGNEDGKAWSKSVMEAGLEVLSVSQFTLYGTLSKGKKPDFHAAMKSTESKPFYHNLLDLLRSSYASDRVKDGAFGEMMEVEIINDGPVTLILDTRQ